MTLWQQISQWWQTASGATTRITATELQAMITAKTPIYLLDVRSSQEFRQDCRGSLLSSPKTGPWSVSVAQEPVVVRR